MGEVKSGLVTCLAIRVRTWMWAQNRTSPPTPFSVIRQSTTQNIVKSYVSPHSTPHYPQLVVIAW